ncbi:PF09594 family protein [Leptospira weilii serovar Ranarum str. ICFT]|uniref:PF09594 family protein n=1 Tax=Leptospira weilii serovar Ranarum str. ICFT TaxID=1218598 RepID=N1WMH1_9LEPT|nr:glycosyltransferase family 87 protein [Leptospira weilii]EMY78432.1 PF09594 family protein [Leptospira weilii serovar Ranarum str. ICFT]
MQLRTWILIGTVLFFSLFFINGISKSGNRSDFRDYYNASVRFTQGNNLYNLDRIDEIFAKLRSGEIKIEEAFTPKVFLQLKDMMEGLGSYIYPPTFAFLLIPISFFPYEVASGVFLTLNFLALLGSLYILSVRFHRKGNFVFLVVLCILNLRFLENHQNNNQVGLILIFLILASVHSSRDWLSGFLLALAIVIKLTPGAFVLFFLIQKRYRAVFYTLAFVCFWIFLPCLYAPSFTIEMTLTWKQLILDNYLKSPLFRAWKNNQSLNATLAKYFLSYADVLNQSRFGYPLQELNESVVKGMYSILSLALVIPFFRMVFTKRNVEFTLGCLFVFSIVFSGISWVHAFVFLLYPSAILLDRVWSFGERSILPVWETKTGSFLKKSLDSVNIIFKKDKVSFFFITGFLLILFCNRSVVGNAVEERLMMASYLLYFAIFQYVLLLLALKYEPAMGNKN